MADQFVQVPADSSGKKIDTSELTVGANTVERQRIVVGDPTNATSLAAVKAASTAAVAADPALVVAVSPNNTIPVSAASLPLPTGAALDATLTGGTQKAIARGGAKGATAAADLTSNPIDANTQALHVDGSKVTQPISAASLPLPTGAALDATLTGGTQQSKVTDGTNIATVKAASTAAVAADKALVVALSPNLGVVQGAANTVANGWPVKVTDGTNTMPTGDVAARAGFEKITDGTNTAAVKAASTNAAATDPALVVILSPNGGGTHYQLSPRSNPATVLSTELNGLANNVQAISSAAIENGTSLDLYADFELLVTFSVAPTAGKTVDLYVVRSVDGGTNYEDGSTSILPASGFVGSFSVRAVATAQRMILPQVVLPPGDFKLILFNNATGQAFAGSGNTVRGKFYRTSIA